MPRRRLNTRWSVADYSSAAGGVSDGPPASLSASGFVLDDAQLAGRFGCLGLELLGRGRLLDEQQHLVWVTGEGRPGGQRQIRGRDVRARSPRPRCSPRYRRAGSSLPPRC